MLSKSVSKMTAQKLRLLLIVSILVLIVLASAGFWLMRLQLIQYANEVQVSTAAASSSTQNLSTLEKLKTELTEDADTVARTKNIVADSKSYGYQDQIIKDINTYAERSGVSVSGYSFNSEGTATPTTGAAQGAAPAAASAKSVSGLKSISVSVNIKSPVKYTTIMNFVHSIEQNLTKMQLAGISFTKDPSSDNVTASALTIEVYVR
jgi:hypothetical protein